MHQSSCRIHVTAQSSESPPIQAHGGRPSATQLRIVHLYTGLPTCSLSTQLTSNPSFLPRRLPSTINPFRSHIAATREIAIAEDEQITDNIQVYCAASGHDGNIGSAAVLFRAGAPPHTLRYYLGTEKEHTVFEAEEVGLTLAAKLIVSENNLTFPLSISIDNQAAIQSGEGFDSRPGPYLPDRFRRMMQKLAKDHPDFDVTVRWIPGHEGVHGNEEANKAAKLAAIGKQHNSPTTRLPQYLRLDSLPLSISALKKAHRNTLPLDPHVEQITRTQQIDPNTINRSFLKFTATFPKRLTSLLMNLRSRHIPLNRHLHRIGKSDSPNCAHCP
ncbi:hypothetical protein AZE42_01138 [Rhizopogon vesiculosus]|uniref:RNase H type-1 domain-containing protein n=1 Tax=Rhizopogon vesiculosus TaxID=180088 RepID=A0A1J8QCS1_9AGAM|nr:hypothetical protein AZE42_01138 [Rhizopogon vesiculosus]